MRLENTVGQAALVFLQKFVIRRVLNQKVLHFLLRKDDRIGANLVLLILMLVEDFQLLLVKGKLFRSYVVQQGIDGFGVHPDEFFTASCLVNLIKSLVDELLRQ